MENIDLVVIKGTKHIFCPTVTKTLTTNANIFFIKGVTVFLITATIVNSR